ncbi:MAG: hypothetical protein JW770_05730 [Actinobacteria bacterium]|nr:hypothetical protein [Actinomycetota bacterium]
MHLFLTVDVGTSFVKTAIFDEDCNLVYLKIMEYKLLTPKINYVEVDPAEYYNALKSTLAEFETNSKYRLQDIKSVAVCSQAETFIVLDKDGNVLRDAIVWLDNRAMEESKTLEEKFGRENTFKITGQQEIIPTWTACKLLWMKKNEPHIYSKIDRILFVEDYMIYRLTGRAVTDYTILPSSLLYDIVKKEWWQDMLDFLEITEKQLPEVMPSGKVIGKISEKAQNELGLSKDVAVVTGAMDHMAGFIGSGNIREGIVTETTGTALAICATTEKPVFDPLMKIPAYIHTLNDKYTLMPWAPTSGVVLKWFRDNFFDSDNGKISFPALDKMSEAVPAGSDGLVVLPFLAGSGSPESDPNAKGVFFGVALSHTRAHFTRAIMESIAYLIRSNIEALENMGITVNEVISLGGGSKSDLWCQIKADVLGKKIIKPGFDEISSLGLAIMSGLATGKFSSLEDSVKRFVKVKKVFIPGKENKKTYDLLYNKYINIYLKLKEEF